MKFNCGPDGYERFAILVKRRERLEQWHPFYAIWPRRVNSRDCRAFEWIERRLIFVDSDHVSCVDDVGIAVYRAAGGSSS